jgi:hypothetical protein
LPTLIVPKAIILSLEKGCQGQENGNFAKKIKSRHFLHGLFMASLDTLEHTLTPIASLNTSLILPPSRGRCKAGALAASLEKHPEGCHVRRGTKIKKTLKK